MKSQLRSKNSKFIYLVLALTFLGSAILAGAIPGAAQTVVPLKQGEGNGKAVGSLLGGSTSEKVDLRASASGAMEIRHSEFILRDAKGIIRSDAFVEHPNSTDTDTNLDASESAAPAPSDSLTINPSGGSLASGGQQMFSAIGGVPPFTFSVVSDTTGGASVNATTGFFIAGPNGGTSTVRVADSLGDTANATVMVSGGGQQTFIEAGVTRPSTFKVVSGTSGGASVNAMTGQNTAGPNGETSSVRVMDGVGKTANATVTVPSSVAGKHLQGSNCLPAGSGCAPSPSNPGSILNLGGGVSRSLTPVSPRVLSPAPGQAAITLPQAGGNGNAIKAFGGSSRRSVNLGVPASPIDSSNLRNGQFTLKAPKEVLQRDNFNMPPDPVAIDANLDPVTVITPVAISPLAVPLASGGQQVFSAIGGMPPYTFSIVADATGGASVNATTGLYTAGPNVGTSRVRVTDANLNTAEAGVTVVAFGLAPPAAVLASGASQQFSAISGTPPYTFSLQGDTTGGASVNATTGLYTAGPNAGTSTVRVTDSNLETADAGITVRTTVTLLSQSPWAVQSFSSQRSSAQSAARAIDGNQTTNWRTSQSASPPHNLQVNLGNVFEIEGFRFLQRVPTEGVFTSFYEFYVSEDGVSWGEPVAAGEFVKSFEEKQVLFPRVAGQYVRIRPLGEHNGRNFIILSELNVSGATFSGNFAPNGTINTPTSNVTINAGSSVSFSGTFNDSNGHSALSYLWDFGDPTLPDSTQEDPGSVVFTTPGTYTVTFLVTDTFGLADPYPDSVTVKVLAGSNTTLPRNNWTIKFVNSEEVILANRVAENVLDSNASTIWQTQFNDVGRPHNIQINLGSAYRLDALRYLPPASSSGRILAYHIYISQDGAEWGEPVAIGSFSNSSAEQRVVFPPKTGQFVRVVALTTNGSPTAAMAEINLEGQCDTPFVELIEPLSQEVEAGPGLRVTASVCLVQPVHAGWGVRLSVDGGAQQQTIPFPSNGQITPSTFQRTFTGISGDNHQVDAVIVNNVGAPVAGPNTSDSVTKVGVGDVYVAIGDSTTVGVGDNNATDATSQDGRNTNTGRGFIPALNNILTAKLGRPHDILNFGYSGESSAGATIRIPKVLRDRPRDTVFLIALGINDANSGMVPSGQGLNPGDSGYSGTFKANLQTLINLLNDPSMGRMVYLAKVSFLLSPPRPPSVISDLIAYNVAIDELVASNGITVTPPNLFTHFQTNPQELQADGIHPTGMGHKSVSTLWCVAITGGTCPAP